MRQRVEHDLTNAGAELDSQLEVGGASICEETCRIGHEEAASSSISLISVIPEAD